MKPFVKTKFWIKLAYWLGIFADGVWAIGLLLPKVFGVLTGNPSFSPDWDVRSIMYIAGILMTAWTILLIWGVQKPIERRFVILLTAFIVLCLSILTTINVLSGDTHEIWILIKTILLFIIMMISYVLSSREKSKLKY